MVPFEQRRFFQIPWSKNKYLMLKLKKNNYFVKNWIMVRTYGWEMDEVMIKKMLSGPTIMSYGSVFMLLWDQVAWNSSQIHSTAFLVAYRFQRNYQRQNKQWICMFDSLFTCHYHKGSEESVDDTSKSSVSLCQGPRHQPTNTSGYAFDDGSYYHGNLQIGHALFLSSSSMGLHQLQRP